MRRLLSILLPLCLALLAPTAAWEASISQNLAITITAATPIVSAFYVATNGSDSNPGTLAAPFATLGKCQTAMQNSSTIKTCYIRAGTYNITPSGSDPCGLGTTNGPAAINITSADNGETWSFYPPDGYNSAIIDGGATTAQGSPLGKTSNGTHVAFCNPNGTGANLIFNGLQFQHFGYAVIYNNGGILTVTNNIFHDLIIATSAQFGAAVVSGRGGLFSNNYCYNMAGGCEVYGGGDTIPGGISDLVISYNVAINTCTASWQTDQTNWGDCGAYYLSDRATTLANQSTNITVKNNFSRDVFAQFSGNCNGGYCGNGMYLDDGASNVTVTGNVFTGFMGTCIFMHGGSNNTAKNNICDFATSGTSDPAGFQAAPGYAGSAMTGNSFTNNILLANYAGTALRGYNFGAPPNSPTIANNAYWNFNGSNIVNHCNLQNGCSGSGGDTNPTNENPLLHCWGPILASTSPVFNSPVSFPTQPSGYDIPGYWGPPGWTMTETGTSPSWSTSSGDGVTCTSSN